MITNRDARFIQRLFVGGCVFAGFCVMLAGIFGTWRPIALDMERRAEVRSPQYVEARRTEILTAVENVRQLDVDLAVGASDGASAAMRLQREAICERVRRAAAEIPEDAVPRGAAVCN